MRGKDASTSPYRSPNSIDIIYSIIIFLLFKFGEQSSVRGGIIVGSLLPPPHFYMLSCTHTQKTYNTLCYILKSDLGSWELALSVSHQDHLISYNWTETTKYTENNFVKALYRFCIKDQHTAFH